MEARSTEAKLLAEGTSAQALLEFDVKTGKKVVVKRYLPGFEAEFEAEKEILSHLAHQNVIKLLGATEDEAPALTVEFGAQGSLVDLVSRPRDEATVRHLFKGIASGVAYLHSQNVAHRDLKPANVVVTSDGAPKLIDFGHACRIDVFGDFDPQEAPHYSGCGTECYMAPELFTGQAYIATKADIFSLGVILFELVVGRRPFERPEENDEVFRMIEEERIDEFWAQFDLPAWATEELKSLIVLMLKYFAEDRPSAAEVLEHIWLAEPNLLQQRQLNDLHIETDFHLPQPTEDSIHLLLASPLKGPAAMSTLESGDELPEEESILSLSSKAIRKLTPPQNGCRRGKPTASMA